MADDYTDTNDGFEDGGNGSVQDNLRKQAMDQESLLIIERALKRDQERRAEFLRDQEREFIDGRDKRRTQIEEMMLGEAANLKREGLPDSQLITAMVEKFFTQVTPQEAFPEIAAELRLEREALALDDELRFFEENAPEAFTEISATEREHIVRMEAQFREHNDLPPLSETIKEMWGDPETRGRILKYGSYGVMAAVLVGSAGAAAPAMVASKVTIRMLPHLAKAVDRVGDYAGRALVRHGVISPETYTATTEKMLALSNQVKTNKYLKAGKFALIGAVAMVAGAAGADAAGLFDGFGAESAAPDAGAGSTTGSEQATDAQITNTDTAAETPKPDAGTENPESTEKAASSPEADTDAGAEAASADVGAGNSTGSRYTAPNVLETVGGLDADWATNVLDGSSGPERDWSPNVLDRASGPAAEPMGGDGLALNTSVHETEVDTASPGDDANDVASLSASDLIQSMREAGLNTTQVEMFYSGGDLSARDLADIVELSDNPAGMMQVLDAQGVDISALDIEIPEGFTEPTAAQHDTSDLAVEPASRPPIEITVEKSDTLSEIIAKQLREQGIEVTNEALYGDGVTPSLVDQIASHNPHISDPDLIYSGDRITIPMEVLHGEPAVKPTLSANALASVDDVVVGKAEAGQAGLDIAADGGGGYQVSAGVAHELAAGEFDLNAHVEKQLDGHTPPADKLDPIPMSAATEVTGDAGQSGLQGPAPGTANVLAAEAGAPVEKGGGIVQDLASGKFDVVDRVNAHLAGYEAPASALAAEAGVTAEKGGGIVHDLASGKFDVVDRVNDHLAGYDASASPHTAEAGAPAEKGDGIVHDLASGKFDVVDHVNESLGGQEEALASNQEATGHEAAGGWRERLAGAVVKAKAFMASFTTSIEPSSEVATTDTSATKMADAGEGVAGERSNWEVLTEAAEKVKSEWAATTDAPSDNVTTNKGSPEGPVTNDQVEPEQKEACSQRMYASRNSPRSPGM